MSEKATHEGADNQEGEQTQDQGQPKVQSARQAAMDAAVARRREQFQEQIHEQGGPEEDEQEDLKAGKDAGEQEEDSGSDGDEPTNADDELVTIKVDGREQRVPRDKVYEFGIRAMQKEIAADARLAEASNMRRQVEAERYALQQKDAEIRALAAKIQEKDQQVGGHPDKGADEYLSAAKEMLHAMYDGEEDVAAASLVKMLKGRANVTPEMMQAMKTEAVQQAKHEVQSEIRKERWDAELRDTTEWFESEHKDIASDPEWRSLADRETVDLMREHPDWFPRKIVEEAVKKVNRLRKSKSATGSRRDIKKQLDTPRGAMVRRPAPQEPAPQTRSGYIQELRRSRGLSV